MTEDLCLKWNDHHSLFFAGAEQLFKNEELTDVTIAAEEELFRAHKIVLSICSTFFSNLFRRLGADKHVIFLKDIRASHLQLLLQYMYAGEVRVQEEELTELLNAAQSLEIRGLTGETDPEANKITNSAISKQLNNVEKIRFSNNSKRFKPDKEFSRNNVKQKPFEKQQAEEHLEDTTGVDNIAQPDDYDGEYDAYDEDYYNDGVMDAGVTCSYCHKTFVSNAHLRQHLPVHTKEKNFVCQFCNKGFTQSSNLYRHQKTNCQPS